MYLQKLIIIKIYNRTHTLIALLYLLFSRLISYELNLVVYYKNIILRRIEFHKFIYKSFCYLLASLT
jgi:hypothetical protein